MGYWKKILPSFIWIPLNELRRDYFPDFKKTYAGEGEDLILSKLFNNKSNGFFIDVGCYHPKINSNTYSFYKKGWKGMNIDANPESTRKFNKLRTRDINLNYGVSLNQSTLEYYKFKESAINTFSHELYQERIKIPSIEFIGKEKINTLPLSAILDKHLPPSTEIDFMDIDVEGLDLEVLKSNDWNKYIPKVILVEDQDTSVNSVEELETFKFLHPKGYKLLAKTFSTLIFIHKSYIK